MFVGELSVFGAYGVKKMYLKREAAKNPNNNDILMSPGTRQAE